MKRSERFVAVGLALTVVLVGSTPAALADGASTETVARQYLELTLARQYDQLPYAADALFVDPTGDIFDRPEPLVGGTRGREAIVALQKSWNLAELRFKADREFFVGEYALFSGTLTVSFAGSSGSTDVTWITILRVVDGEVTERTDYGDYAHDFGASEEQLAIGDATRVVADAYLAAYLEQDHDTALEMLAGDATVQDPTARVFGGPESGLPTQGAAQIVERRRQGFATIGEFGLKVEQSFASTRHAVYIGTTHYTMRGDAVGSKREWVAFEHPAVFVIGVEDGKVFSHRDYVDYSDFREQLGAQISAATEPGTARAAEVR